MGQISALHSQGKFLRQIGAQIDRSKNVVAHYLADPENLIYSIDLENYVEYYMNIMQKLYAGNFKRSLLE